MTVVSNFLESAKDSDAKLANIFNDKLSKIEFSVKNNLNLSRIEFLQNTY